MLDDRAKLLLKDAGRALHRRRQPVGSRTLSRASGLELSPATIRNVMSDLEELGLIASPHTSAGRIPTARGYRLFVDTMLTAQRWSRCQARPHWRPSSRQKVIANAAQMLSNLSQFVGVVMAPRKRRRVSPHRVPAPVRAAPAGHHRGARWRRAKPRHLHRSRLHPASWSRRPTSSTRTTRAWPSSRCASACKHEVESLRGEIATLMQAAVQAGTEAMSRGAGRSGHLGERNLLAVSDCAPSMGALLRVQVPP
jgi:heat-inducible transcriptional repressor